MSRPTARDLDAWHAYRRLHLFADAEIARELEQDTGLSMPDYEVLTGIDDLWTPDSCVRVRGLAAHLHWPHSRLSRQLGRMEKRGLIAREACERDGRGDDVLLTEAGRTALRDATPAHRASIARHFTDLLTPAQLTALTEIEQAVARNRTTG
ncbi:MarR family winged helix-turn-helix transcriptional regulator [Nocardia sp. NPDC003693]